MGADLFSAEIKRTLDPFGEYRKHADRGYKVKPENGAKGALGRSDLEPGYPDATFVCQFGGCFIESKTGDSPNRIRFSFDNWRPNQRLWYERYAKKKKIDYWIFLVMGETITSKPYGRMALLIDAESFLTEEVKAGERKSLSYLQAQSCSEFRLDWAKNGRWTVPIGHPFSIRFKLGDIDHDTGSIAATG